MAVLGTFEVVMGWRLHCLLTSLYVTQLPKHFEFSLTVLLRSLSLSCSIQRRHFPSFPATRTTSAAFTRDSFSFSTSSPSSVSFCRHIWWYSRPCSSSHLQETWSGFRLLWRKSHFQTWQESRQRRADYPSIMHSFLFVFSCVACDKWRRDHIYRNEQEIIRRGRERALRMQHFQDVYVWMVNSLEWRTQKIFWSHGKVLLWFLIQRR